MHLVLLLWRSHFTQSRSSAIILGCASREKQLLDYLSWVHFWSKAFFRGLMVRRCPFITKSKKGGCISKFSTKWSNVTTETGAELMMFLEIRTRSSLNQFGCLHPGPGGQLYNKRRCTNYNIIIHFTTHLTALPAHKHSTMYFLVKNINNMNVSY